jgi:phosphoribosyl-ATP pyrophosphohydrolase/phosphoribosyl-AMP cyclohydrolase
MLIPSIDLMDGKAVQLVGGREKALEVADVIGLARRFRVYGEIAVIDLDAALGRGDNRSLVERLCREARCRVGGGVRDRRRAEELLRAGAERVIIGTAADEALLASLPRERVMVAVDHRDGTLLSHGWQSAEQEAPLERMRRLAPLCAGFLVTRVDREGRCGGADFEAARELRAATGRALTYAGGVATAAEVAALDRLGLDAQVGMALYTGRLDPAEAFAVCLDFEKGGGRLPCVVEDTAGRVRMLAWQTPESLRRALAEGRGIYHSRSRDEVWVKGATSGHTQALLRARADCDRDAVLFTVDQQGPACHTGTATCFGPADFRLEDLASIISGRLVDPPAGSYTARLLADPELLDGKLREELEEVVEATQRPDELVWECADLLYHLLVRMAAAGVSLRRVAAELARRNAVPNCEKLNLTKLAQREWENEP